MSICFFKEAPPVSPTNQKAVAAPARIGLPVPGFLRPLFFFGIIPALLFAALYSGNINGGIDLFHEGEMLAPAFEVIQGNLPFRDIYLQHGWGANLLRSQFAFALFGESIGANRKLLYGAAGVLSPVVWIGVYLLLFSLFRHKLWILPALALLGLADVRITDRHLLPFLSFALLLWGTKGPRGVLLLAGTAAGAAIFYSLDTGIYALLIGVAFLAAYSIGEREISFSDCGKMTGRFAAGAAIGALPFVLYLLLHGILDDFVMNSFLQIRYQREVWGIPPPSPISLLGPFENATLRNRTFYVIIKWYFPAMVYALTALAMIPALRNRALSEKDAPVLLALLMGIIFFPSALGRADEGHLMYAIAPFWMLGMCLLERSASGFLAKKHPYGEEHLFTLARLSRWTAGPIAAGVFVCAMGLYFWATCRNGGIIEQRLQLLGMSGGGRLPGYVTLRSDRGGGIMVPARQAEEIEETVAFIVEHTRANEPIFDFSNQGAYYFLSGRRNSTMFCQAAYAIPLALQEKALEQLGKSPPAAVLFSDAPDYSPHERQPLLDEWIRQRYKEAAHIGHNIVLLPVGEQAPAT